MTGGEATPQELALARALAADAAGAEVVGALREQGIEPILLKGATLARWLYPGEVRPYGDTDLLVDPEAIWTAASLLERLGFRPVKQHVSLHSHPWVRERDGANVDLHVNLWGADRRPEVVWAELQRWTEPARLGGREVTALNLPGRALYVALHAAQHAEDEVTKPQEDLRRALERTPEGAWREAEQLADRLSALPFLVRGLEQNPAGRALLDRLPLARAARLATGGQAPLAVGFARLGQARGARAKLSVVMESLLRPPEEYGPDRPADPAAAGVRPLTRIRHAGVLALQGFHTVRTLLRGGRGSR